jgi:acetyl esterase
MFKFSVKEHIYKSEQGALRLFVFDQSHQDKRLKPALIFLHGAGFSHNKVNPSQFQHHANYFSSLGIISICVEYRPSFLDGLYSPIDSISNAKSAIRWVRQNADILGIDPTKVVACGASAGGYLSLCCAMIHGFDDINDDLSIECSPNALVIFNGGVDSKVLIELFPGLSLDLVNANPIDAIKSALPPSIFFHGTDDKNIPIGRIEQFIEKMRSHGNQINLEVFEGMGHGFFNYGNHENIPYLRTVEQTKNFLEKQDLLG